MVDDSCDLRSPTPGQNGYIGSCRTGFKSVATWLIGSGRLLFVGFRCYPLYSFDIRWSDSRNSDKILTVGIGQIRSQDLFASDVIQGNLVSRNRRILWFYHEIGFHDKTVQSPVSELVELYKNTGVPLIGFFRVGSHRSNRDQLLMHIWNN